MRTPNALPAAPGNDAGLVVSLARTEDDVRAAQRLRWQVFVEELGATVESDGARSRRGSLRRTLRPSAGARARHRRRDRHLPHAAAGACRPCRRSVRRGRVPPHAAARPRRARRDRPRLRARGSSHRGGDLAALDRAAALPPRRRPRVRHRVREHRRSATTWRAAAALCRRLALEHGSPPEWRVFPRRPLPCDLAPGTREASLPPLLKGYLRLGAYVCGEPAWDPAFGTADVLLLLPLERLSQRHAARLLRAA